MEQSIELCTGEPAHVWGSQARVLSQCFVQVLHAAV